MARIVIVQPYVPDYREPLFSELHRILTARGDELAVVSGAPEGDARERRDSVLLRDVEHIVIPVRKLRVGSFELRTNPSPRSWNTADAVIVELAAGSLPTYRALLQARPVGVWGHVGSYVAPDSLATRTLRAWQVRHAAHVLAYTERGKATAIEYGAKAEDVTVLRNTVETRLLREHLDAARNRSEQSVRSELSVPDRPSFAVIGALDETKRVDLLESVLDRLWQDRSPVHLIVGGRGRQEARLHRARDRGQVTMLGHVGAHQKALMARLSIAILNPGRVGLVAVESLALGIPIVTVPSDFHAPEFDYLVPGEDAVVVEPSAEAIVAVLNDLITRPDVARALGQNAEARAGDFSIRASALAMGSAIDRLLDR